MNLAWHIARKDARRLLIPWMLWLAFILGTSVWFWASAGPTGEDSGGWLRVLTVWTRLIVATQGFFGFVLVGVMVLEDPLVGRDAFWPTRPISRRRLMGAKLLGAILLFVVAPSVILVPVWVGVGFSLGEATTAVMDSAVWHALVSLLALAVAGLAANLAQHLFFAVIVVAAHIAVALLAAFTAPPIPISAAPGYFYSVPAPLMLSAILAAVAWHQFQTGKTRRSWGLLSITLLVTFGFTQGWWRRPAGPDMDESPRLADTRVSVNAEKITARLDTPIPTPSQRRHRSSTIELRTAQSPGSGILYRPVAGSAQLTWSAGEPMMVRFRSAPGIPESAVRAAVGAGEMPRDLSGELVMHRVSEPEMRLPSQAVRLHGVVSLEVFRARVLGTLLVQEGATLRAGANRVLVMAIVTPNGRDPTAIVIQERDAGTGESVGVEAPDTLAQRADWIDVFVLRAGNTMHVLYPEENGAVAMRSLVVGVRRLTLPPLTGEELENATLVKIRFEREETFNQRLESQAVEVVGDRTS